MVCATGLVAGSQDFDTHYASCVGLAGPAIGATGTSDYGLAMMVCLTTTTTSFVSKDFVVVAGLEGYSADPDLMAISRLRHLIFVSFALSLKASTSVIYCLLNN